MPAFGQHYNTDNILFRSVIIGTLNLLNRNIAYEQSESETETKELTVPFFYYMFQNERFMQDLYGMYETDCKPTVAEGNYDPVPRGVINIASLSINSASLTSKFTRGTYNKEVDGTVKAFSAYLNPIPLKIMFDVEVICGTYLESFKIIQSIIDTFYKVATFAVDFKGLRVPCSVGFSEDYSIERPVTFSFSEDSKIVMKFNLEMETAQPVFDKSSERFRGNVMDHGIGNEIGTSGYANLELTPNPSLTKDEDTIPPPDFFSPFGYDGDGQPIKP